MATVHLWTGLEAHALRRALRMSVRVFAAHLGVAVRTVSKWDQLGAATEPRPDTQAILDVALARADAAAHLRFETCLSEMSRVPAIAPRVTTAGPRMWEYETWTDDLDRVVVALAKQSFAFAEAMLGRWLTRFQPGDLDDKGLYLFARSTTLLGDLQRDRGALQGPMSAMRKYSDAHAVYSELGIPRRVAQLDLSLAVVTEMAGRLTTAAHQYEALAVDDRLSPRDRVRARLWVGTALSKGGEHDYAARVMAVAIRDFEDLNELDDWSVAHQKLALARRGAGDLTAALQLIDVARSTAATDSPLHQVRLNTAYGHILISDPATVHDGLKALDRAAQVATSVGLVHQLRAIEDVRQISQGATIPLSTVIRENE
ncbi:helix-turn-helix domain-containing protein [Nonomuraea sp. bgisy101]|uniref:helix-turn-helix domain-containing protein n=1 Tax=Nonomuraea sp. bgisy101 TaxID=3413784 RepID=UPI003D745E11